MESFHKHLLGIPAYATAGLAIQVLIAVATGANLPPRWSLGIQPAAGGDETRVVGGEEEQDWTVVTMARDGSWGIGADRYIGAANATAVRECKSMSSGRSDCGAEFAATRGGWIVGLRCDDYRILATGNDLKEAEAAALYREIDLKQLYVPDLPPCQRVLTVNPRGEVTSTSPRVSGPP